jgi:nucleotide-binding universal stress UspA family protein
MTPTLHPLGIVSAVVFALSLGLLFWWMFRVPPQVPQEVAAVRRSVAALQRILVPVSGRVTSERAVELACRLGEPQKAEIVLAYVIEVPFTLSLSTSVPAEEAKGQEALRTARFIVEQHALPVKTRIVPNRYAADGILRLTREEQVDLVVMSVGGRHPGGEVLGRTSQEVARRAECEVILDKVASRGG